MIIFSTRVQLVFASLSIILFLIFTLVDVSTLKSTFGASSTFLTTTHRNASTENSSELCISGYEGSSVLAVCKSGVITKIAFASFGTPTTNCTEHQIDESCHSQKSLEVAESRCLNNNHCMIQIGTKFFGDPCIGKYKRFVMHATCEHKD
eukprot:TRINITY_DN2020_c0_g4_i2.p1 TRINITY_DN2020_c0_g4~~TRINITY_DN2020_c0_g4_i2.p1  ORF type:complete len:150 (-),score=12.16 TRINITY_DN2020_c0_g4_i2:29-478(-)